MAIEDLCANKNEQLPLAPLRYDRATFGDNPHKPPC